MLVFNLRLARRESNEARTTLAFLLGLGGIIVTLQLGLYGALGWLTPGKVFAYVWEHDTDESLLFLHGLVWLLILWQRTLALAGEGVGIRTTAVRFRGSLLLVVGAWVVAAGRDVSFPFGLALIDLLFGFSALALARAESVSRDVAGQLPFTPRWAATLGAALALILGLGWLFGTLLVRTDFGFLSPLLIVLDRLSYLLFVVLAWLLEPLFEVLVVLAQFLLSLSAFEEIASQVNPLFEQDLDQLGVEGMLGNNPLIVALRVIVTLVVGFIVLLLIAATLRRAGARRRALAGEGRESIYESGALGDDLSALLRGSLNALAGAVRRRLPHTYGVETVRELYKNLQLYGARQGAPRPPESTPAEYLAVLEGLRPDRREELRALTEAYIHAHYGERVFNREEVRALQEAWRRIAADEGEAGAE
jgi:hypothetical protein